MSQVQPPIVAAFISSIFALIIAVISLTVTHRSRRMETTRDILKRYFSADFTVIRRESFPALKTFWELNKSGADMKSSLLLKYLINRLPHEVVFTKELGTNHLAAEQNTLIFLYFWAEVQAYRRRGLLEPDVVREVLISQWEFYREVMIQLVSAYERVASVDPDAKRLTTPPWATAIKAIDKWMQSRTGL
jgi:hypothetical protein